MFTFEADVSEEHAYLVGSLQGGLTDVLATIRLDERFATFEGVRSKIEMKPDATRTILFREVLFECLKSKNPHCWDERIRRSSYRLGYFKDEPRSSADLGQTPLLVPLEQEATTNLTSLSGSDSSHTASQEVVQLIIVPLSQVGPGCNACCRGCLICTEARLPGSSVKTKFYYDGHIHEVFVHEVDSITTI